MVLQYSSRVAHVCYYPSDPTDIAADPAHLYGFVQQLERLRVTLPPPPISVSCMPFEVAPFRSLHSLKVHHSDRYIASRYTIQIAT